jgi:hypothetical protein
MDSTTQPQRGGMATVGGTVAGQMGAVVVKPENDEDLGPSHIARPNLKAIYRSTLFRMHYV